MKRQSLLLLFALSIASALLAIGCGGGSDSSSSQGTPGQAESSPPETQSPSRSQGQEAKGGEASIEEFGDEAEGSERGAILAAFHGYLEAVAQKDYAASCAYLSNQVHESLQQLIQSTKIPCPKALAAVASPEAAAVAKAQAEGEIARVRVEGQRAFVVFHAPGAKLYYLQMVEEGGQWKAGSPVAAVLVPEL